ncbi:hypothetical protein E2P81_ATG03002 [Venturia nashicola]|uniref:Uncharacterized protein n=1 Tax=Venturia nashicola TaxID=86259 RepID=A0A4Z1PE59_9PEZI|nr:hypothetical protein E6O75_ATG03067 [Venturia nashicola]TLD36113.1 hypothetical protein E2P81_ATG03002 [Venturia nashicola]
MSFDPKPRSPTSVKLIKSRLAPIREHELIIKALDPKTPLKAPADGRELRVWKECWRDRDEERLRMVATKTD